MYVNKTFKASSCVSLTSFQEWVNGSTIYPTKSDETQDVFNKGTHGALLGFKVFFYESARALLL